MNTFSKATLMAGASALVLGMAASQASAFEEVDWDWYADIKERININIDIKDAFDPSGLVQVESLQIFAGDVKAYAYVDKAINVPEVKPSGEYLVTEYWSDGSIRGKFEFDGHIHDENPYKVDYWGNIYSKPDTDKFSGEGKFYANWWEHTKVKEQLFAPLDALTQLPVIEVAATALGNAQNIDSEVGVLVHAGQFVFGDIESKPDHTYDDVGDWVGSTTTKDVNSNLRLADALLELMADNELKPAKITAYADILEAYNYQVDLSATAVANSHSIDVEAMSVPGDEENAFVIADITQFAYADVTATAYLGTTVVNNYKNLGQLENALTSVTATAVGNISTITVDINNNASLYQPEP